MATLSLMTHNPQRRVLATLPFWRAHDTYKKTAWAVDPAEAEKMQKAAEEHQLTVTAILATHHHADHSGGNNVSSIIPLMIQNGLTGVP